MTNATVEKSASILSFDYVSSDEIRSRFSQALSVMYRQEVPQYGKLLELVEDVNSAALICHPDEFVSADDRHRLDIERHGAIRVGTPRELKTLCRIFAIMGMQAVGYYDLSVAGVPVHSTAFRPVESAALAANPFRVFTSLLRLELIEDAALRDEAAKILRNRNIFSQRTLQLLELFERDGGITSRLANEFVLELLETFRWQSTATVSFETYRRLNDAHRLIADVVCFKGAHINHLTPRTIDIDAAQAEMRRRGIPPKNLIEGPPRRRAPILLRQTSFKALEEPVRFAGPFDKIGTHTARFGEIEQRGLALTRKGRAMYDALLDKVQRGASAGDTPADYEARLKHEFREFPDDLTELRRAGLGFFRYSLQTAPAAHHEVNTDLETLIARGVVRATPIAYEDFLPVSAAGIFQSNLGGEQVNLFSAGQAKGSFEDALGCAVLDEIALYEAQQAESIKQTLEALRVSASSRAASVG